MARKMFGGTAITVSDWTRAGYCRAKNWPTVLPLLFFSHVRKERKNCGCLVEKLECNFSLARTHLPIVTHDVNFGLAKKKKKTKKKKKKKNNYSFFYAIFVWRQQKAKQAKNQQQQQQQRQQQQQQQPQTNINKQTTHNNKQQQTHPSPSSYAQTKFSASIHSRTSSANDAKK